VFALDKGVFALETFRNVESVSSPQQNLRPLQPTTPTLARRSMRCRPRQRRSRHWPRSKRARVDPLLGHPHGRRS